MRHHLFCCSQNSSLHPFWVCPPTSTSQIKPSYSSMHSSSHPNVLHFLPVFPTSPQEFATIPRSIPCAHQCTLLSTNTLPPWQVLAATLAAPALRGCCLAIWHSKLPAQVTAFQQLVDQAEQTASLLCPSFLG